jgi:hypothetical protein
LSRDGRTEGEAKGEKGEDTPPSELPGEEDVREFERKYREFFEALPENEKLQAASLMVLLAAEEKLAAREQVGKGEPERGASERGRDRKFCGQVRAFPR